MTRLWKWYINSGNAKFLTGAFILIGIPILYLAWWELKHPPTTTHTTRAECENYWPLKELPND